MVFNDVELIQITDTEIQLALSISSAGRAHIVILLNFLTIPKEYFEHMPIKLGADAHFLHYAAAQGAARR